MLNWAAWIAFIYIAIASILRLQISWSIIWDTTYVCIDEKNWDRHFISISFESQARGSHFLLFYLKFCMQYMRLRQDFFGTYPNL